MKNFSQHYLIWILMGIILFLIGISVFLWLSLPRPLEVRELTVIYYVGDNVGFDLNTTSLTFGKLVQGSSSIRTITIDNYYSFPVRVDVLASDSLINVLSAEPSFIVNASSSRNISFVINIPPEFPKGNYSGNVSFVFNKNQ